MLLLLRAPKVLVMPLVPAGVCDARNTPLTQLAAQGLGKKGKATPFGVS